MNRAQLDWAREWMAIVSDVNRIAYHSHLTNYPEIPDSSINKDQSMACKCLEEIPEMVKSACNEHKDFSSPVTKVEWLELRQSALDKQGELSLATTMKIHTEKGVFPTYKPNFFTYCPFCGVKYQGDK